MTKPITMQDLVAVAIPRYQHHPYGGALLDEDYSKIFVMLSLEQGTSLLQRTHKFHTSRRPEQVRERIKALLAEAYPHYKIQTLSRSSDQDYFFIINCDREEVLMVIDRSRRDISYVGIPDAVESLHRRFSDLDIDTEYPILKLTWDAKNAEVQKTPSWFSLDQLGHNEFWPFLPGGADAFFQGFMASKASVLILYGEAGTGKSSFSRTMIARHKLKAAVGFDGQVIVAPQTYDMLQTHHLFLEDADLYLGDRTREGNVQMSSILNATEGIIKRSTSQKLVISTNLPSIDKIDPALRRPGRCYGAIKFRALSQVEARTVQTVTGNHEVDLTSKKDWTLSSVLNPVHHVDEKGTASIGYTNRN